MILIIIISMDSMYMVLLESLFGFKTQSQAIMPQKNNLTLFVQISQLSKYNEFLAK